MELLRFVSKFPSYKKLPVLPSYKTNQLITCANQLTSYYIRTTLVFNELMVTFLFTQLSWSKYFQVNAKMIKTSNI